MTSKWSFWRDWIFLIGFLCRSNSLETRSFFLCAGPRQVASRSQKLGVGGFPFPNCSCLLSASRQSPSPSPTRASFRSPSSLFLNCSFFFFFLAVLGLHCFPLAFSRASLVSQTVKNLPAVQETWFQSLDQEDPPGEENGNPFQYPHLENPMGRGAQRGYSPWGHRVPLTNTFTSRFLQLQGAGAAL